MLHCFEAEQVLVSEELELSAQVCCLFVADEQVFVIGNVAAVDELLGLKVLLRSSVAAVASLAQME